MIPERGGADGDVYRVALAPDGKPEEAVAGRDAGMNVFQRKFRRECLKLIRKHVLPFFVVWFISEFPVS